MAEYALWLVPSQQESAALRHLMNFRPQQHRSKTHRYKSYPRFDPHVALATFSSYPTLPLAELLPMVKATPVHFESLRVGGSYMSSVSIEISRSRELMDLHNYTVEHLKQAHGIHVTSRSSLRMPLFFLDETVQGERRRLADILRTSGRVIEGRSVADVALNCTLDGGAPEFDAMKGFFGSDLWLVDCSGDVRDWNVLEKRRLVRREYRMPTSGSYICRPNPVIPMAPSHSGFFGSMSLVPHELGATSPFSYRPKPGPVIPAASYCSHEPRKHAHHYARGVSPNIASVPATRQSWGGYHGYR